VKSKALAEAPVTIHQRQTDRGIGVEHLLRSDNLDLDRVDIEAEFVESNPLDPVVWSDRIADTVDIPFNWLATEDRAYELEKAKERLTSMVKRHHEHSLQTEIGRIVDEVCAKHGIMNDHEAIDPAKQPAIFAEITARLGAHSVGIPHQQMLTSDEIKRLLRP